MKKRIVSLLLALVMAVSLLPVSAFAVDVDTPQDDAPVAETQTVPAAEQQNDENTTPDTPAEEPQQQDAESAGGEDQSEEPAAEPKIYVTSNIWDKNVEVVTTPSSVKGGETGEFTYGKRALTIGVANPITIGTATCKVSTVVVNGVEYEYTGENYNLVAGTVDGFSKGVSIARELGSIRFAFGGVLSKDVQVKFVYDNVPANPDETATFSPVVTSSNATHGSVTAAFSANEDNSSIWTVTATPKDEWYKLDYVADEAGNQFASRDGKTAQITVTAADQKFTAYFTAAVAPMYDETNADSVTVNVTISNDGIPLMGKDGTILANLDVTVPYFDLDDYGLGKYYRYGTEFGWGSYNNDTVIERPTALHAYIYIIERYYMGLPASQCGKGTSGILDYKKATDVLYMDGGLAYNSNRTPALNPTGSATSLYMKQFWGHDENLMYFRNHEYPLMGKGWGSTCDYILLSDGDRLDVGLFTNWDFYKDGGFNQFSQDAYTVMAGETLTATTFKAGTSAGLDGESPALEPISGLKAAVYDANWNKIGDMDGDGAYSYTFTKAGTYYIMATDAGAKTTAAHYAPATAKVTVAGEPEKNADEYYQIKNAADMYWFQQYVNEQGHYDAKAKLAADIDISGLDWQGLGENINHYSVGNSVLGYQGDKMFSGEIDGQGHTLTVSFTGSPLVNLLTGTVKNLTIKGKSEAGAAFVRYLLYQGRIEDCVNYASVSGKIAMGQMTEAGATAAFAGVAAVGGSYGRVTGIVRCVNYGDVQSDYDHVAGILGQIANSVANAVEIKSCKNYGIVTSKAFSSKVSGMVNSSMGLSKGIDLADCENHGAISAVNGGTAAGIMADMGSAQQTISRCLNTGSIFGFTAGGIVGYCSGGAVTLIESCYNTGSISGGTAGGIVGTGIGELTNCYNTGDVTGNLAGGIAGNQVLWQYPNTHNYDVGKVSNCYTTGKVTGSTGATIGAAVGKLHTGGGGQNTYRDFQVYALEGTCAQLVGQKSENAKDVTAFKTAAELKSDAMLTTLGDGFKADGANINNGYPVLVWQVSEPCTKHTPGEIVKVSIQNANCTTGGRHYDVVYCTVCLKELSRTIVTDEPLGHDWDSATGKCKRCGITCDHKWTNGKCDTCGYACQHVGGDAVKEKEVPATCTKDGSHDEVVYCTICKAEVSRKTVTDKALGHKEQPAVKENVKAPTCTADGSHDEVVYCSVCKAVVSRTNVVDKATGHKWDDGVVTTQPTTGKEGVKTFTCTVCKETKTETIDKLGEDKKDESAANEAINLINGIGTVTKGSKDKIDAARKAYDGLTEDQKKLVPDSVLKTLTDAEAAYAKLTKPGTKPGKPSTSTDTKKDDGKTVKSGQTGDAGIVLYAAMGLVAVLAGAVIITRKRKEN